MGTLLNRRRIMGGKSIITEGLFVAVVKSRGVNLDTLLLYNSSKTSLFTKMWIDKKELPNVVASYKFSDSTYHTIYFEPASSTVSTADMFWNCSLYRSFVIPNTITTIGGNSFRSCSSLTSVILPDSITSISSNAFLSCIALQSIEFPTSVTTIAATAFDGCSSLTSVVIPQNITSIGAGAFMNCYKIESIVVDINNTVYDSRDNCNAIIKTSTNEVIQGCKNTVIPDDIVSIPNNAFTGCSIVSITIPSTTTSIGNLAFVGCSLLSTITVDTNNAVYDSRNNCNAIVGTSSNKIIVGCAGTTVPSSITAIGASSFRTNGLASFVVPTNITTIEDYAFYKCTKLTSVIIGSGVTAVGTRSFSDASNLVSVTVEPIIPPSGVNMTFESNKSGRKIYVPSGSVDTYKAASGWSRYANVIEAIQE